MISDNVIDKLISKFILKINVKYVYYTSNIVSVMICNINCKFNLLEQ